MLCSGCSYHPAHVPGSTILKSQVCFKFISHGLFSSFEPHSSLLEPFFRCDVLSELLWALNILPSCSELSGPGSRCGEIDHTPLLGQGTPRKAGGSPGTKSWQPRCTVSNSVWGNTKTKVHARARLTREQEQSSGMRGEFLG